jgi:hypothetical protein
VDNHQEVHSIVQANSLPSGQSVTKSFLQWAFLLFLLPGTGAAQERLLGSYTLDPASSDDIKQAINLATKDLGFLVRPLARKRLRDLNPLSRTVSIERIGEEIEVVVNGEVRLRSPTDGRRMDWRYKDEQLVVMTLLEGDVLTQTFVSEDGEKTNTYRALPDGNLTLDVRITSPRLRRPVQYKLVFHPTQPALPVGNRVPA